MEMFGTTGKNMYKSKYLHMVYDNYWFPQVIDHAEKALRIFGKKTRFQALAFSGMSGAAIAFPLALRLNKKLMCVRKKDNSHYKGSFEGDLDSKKYVIVDDCIETGKTIKRIKKAVERNTDSVLAAIYLYDQREDRNLEVMETYQGVPVFHFEED